MNKERLRWWMEKHEPKQEFREQFDKKLIYTYCEDVYIIDEETNEIIEKRKH